MKITLSELELAFARVLGKLKEEGHNVIDLGELDQYWTILAPDWTDMSQIPEPSVGSFLDDLESLKLLTDKDRPTTYVDFDRTAALLQLISERLNPV